MSTLRRRFLGDSSTEASRAPSPVNGEPVALVPKSHLQKLTKKRSRRQWLVFGLGGLFGILIAAFFAQRNDVINLEGLMDMNLESLIDVIPAGIVNDAKDITVCLRVLRAIREQQAEADTAPDNSDPSVKPSIMIPSLLASIYSRKG